MTYFTCLAWHNFGLWAIVSHPTLNKNCIDPRALSDRTTGSPGGKSVFVCIKDPVTIIRSLCACCSHVKNYIWSDPGSRARRRLKGREGKKWVRMNKKNCTGFKLVFITISPRFIPREQFWTNWSKRTWKNNLFTKHFLVPSFLTLASVLRGGPL